MRELKITTIQGFVFLYPIPVLRDNKYLIRCESEEKANELIDEVSNRLISHPDLHDHDFKVVGIHTDQQTEIIERN